MKGNTWIVMGVINLILGGTGLGYLPIPNPGSALTVLHIPALLAGMLDGPLAGLLVGGIFGMSSLFWFPPHDWMIQFLPRLMIGLTAWLAFTALQDLVEPKARLTLGAFGGAAAGSLTNTLGVTAMMVLRGGMPLYVVWPMAAFHGMVELLLAVCIALPVVVLHRQA